MISSLKTIVKEKGRSFAQLVMKHYGKLKPLLFWVNVKTRELVVHLSKEYLAVKERDAQ